MNMTKRKPVEVGCVVQKRVAIKGDVGIFEGRYQVLGITFTGTEDVADLKDLDGGPSQCVDVALLQVAA